MVLERAWGGRSKYRLDFLEADASLGKEGWINEAFDEDFDEKAVLKSNASVGENALTVLPKNAPPLPPKRAPPLPPKRAPLPSPPKSAPSPPLSLSLGWSASTISSTTPWGGSTASLVKGGSINQAFDEKASMMSNTNTTSVERPAPLRPISAHILWGLVVSHRHSLMALNALLLNALLCLVCCRCLIRPERLSTGRTRGGSRGGCSPGGGSRRGGSQGAGSQGGVSRGLLDDERPPDHEQRCSLMPPLADVDI